MAQKIQQAPIPSTAGGARAAVSNEWRLYALFRPGGIYVHLYSPGAFASRPVRLSVAGLSEEARAVLSGLTRGQVVPEHISAALIRVNRLC